jgi:hypothetical protein
MRTIGFVLVVIGAAVIYLGWNGKIGAAITALITGNAPVSNVVQSSTPQSNKPIGGNNSVNGLKNAHAPNYLAGMHAMNN